ncbi:GMC family oxidoreductase [Rheinheimera sp.]|uniref:GMC family oxidoreductase n=1 Tax=Rheinheimera sp. TaxID=1869214 RepID=UPI00307DF053
MIVDSSQQPIQIEKGAYDVVIAGAGAVGLTMAVTLSRRGKKVLVLESGGVGFEAESQAQNIHTLTGLHHFGIEEGRARIVGGTTTLWGGQIVPFAPIDFIERDWVQNSGWPLSYIEMQQHYAAIYQLLGLPQHLKGDADVWQHLNIKIPQNNNFDIFLTRWLKETNLKEYFKKDLTQSDLLTVVTHATVTNLFMDDSGCRVGELEYSCRGGEKKKLASDIFVLANGAIEASRLMLWIASQNENVPWASNKLVGKFYQDHLDIRAARVRLIDAKKFARYFDNILVDGFKFQPKIKFNETAQRSLQALNIAASFIFESSLSEQIANVKLFIRALRRGAVPPTGVSLLKNLGAVAKVMLPLAIRYIRDRRILNLHDKGIYLNLHCEQFPIVESQIGLDFSRRDIVGMPATLLNWQVSGQEVRTMRQFCELLDQWLREEQFGYLEIDPRILQESPEVIAACTDTNHQCGGLRMATTKDAGVVDSNCRVFGVENLFIAGAAVFPTSSYANSTFHAMALGNRICVKMCEEQI